MIVDVKRVDAMRSRLRQTRRQLTQQFAATSDQPQKRATCGIFPRERSADAARSAGDENTLHAFSWFCLRRHANAMESA